MPGIGGLLVFLTAILTASAASQSVPTLSDFITQHDRVRLKAVFESARPYQDLAAVHYSVLGNKLMGEALTNSPEVCQFITSKVDASNLESIYHASAVTRVLPSCKLTLPNIAQQTVNNALLEDTSVADLFYAVLASNRLGYKYDSAKVLKTLLSALKRDDSVLNLGYAFHIASLLSVDVNSVFERIEDAIVQADEVDNKMAQFEGGLSITAIIISGAYRLAEHVKKPPVIDKEKCIKFANYFLSRKHVQVVRAAFHLLDVLNVLTTNKYHIPVAITLASKIAVSNQEPIVQIRVTNLLGSPLSQLTVTIDTATHLEDEAVVLSKKPLLVLKSDSSLYELNFLQAKPARGFYRLLISAVPSKADDRLIGNSGAPVEIKVMTEVTVEALEIGTVDVDQATSSKMSKVVYPNKLPVILEADYHQKIQMKFTIRDKNDGIMSAHQVFIRLTNKRTKQEIIFVSEPDSSLVYRFDMDVNSKAKDFGYLSGEYQLDLILGDAIISNPFLWLIADVEISFPDNPSPSPLQENQYTPKHEIQHIFREPEKRPSTVVSNTFTALTVAPLLLLFVLWYKVGVNFYNFHLNLGTIGFHVGLSAIFGLFTVFWLNLNMFTTLKYLALLGMITFLCGNSMLSKIAASRKKG
uniref:Dolichyl-diphosphooligosaccharide--protein glycosyltransferase subunit 2 n=1 Tax=Scolopendra viridis TaxID=118503 RepID=A0A4D5R9X7_SCOVI